MSSLGCQYPLRIRPALHYRRHHHHHHHHLRKWAAVEQIRDDVMDGDCAAVLHILNKKER